MAEHDEQHLRALVGLLDDADPEIARTLLARLDGDAELLDRAWTVAVAAGTIPEALTQLVLRADAEALVDAIAAAEDLETGMWLLARINAPRIDHMAAGAPALDALALRAPAGDGRAIASFLVGDCGFSGDRRTYEEPCNSYLPQVLERRLGLPIALTALWMLVCRRRQVRAEAIALPGHVVGRWIAEDGMAGYLDLFHGGRALTRPALDALVSRAGGGDAGPYLAAASDRALIKRMARNLARAYLTRGDVLRATIAHAVASV